MTDDTDIDTDDDARGPKERAYDEHISPLVVKIIELCREHNINAFATFALDLDEDDDDPRILRCTTSLPIDKSDKEGYALVCKLHDIVKPKKAQWLAYHVGPDGVPHIDGGSQETS